MHGTPLIDVFITIINMIIVHMHDYTSVLWTAVFYILSNNDSVYILMSDTENWIPYDYMYWYTVINYIAVYYSYNPA